MTEEENEEIVRVHEQLGPLFRSRRFAEACDIVRDRREQALVSGRHEQASSFSELLATCLTMASRDAEALQAARDAERIEPNSLEAKLTTARILLNYADSPNEALAKLREAMRVMPAEFHGRYAALALLGTALARTGDVEGAISVFREMTTPEVLQRLAAGHYYGVYDLSLVYALVTAGVAKAECRQYLDIVKTAPGGWPHLQRKLDEMIELTRDA